VEVNALKFKYENRMVFHAIYLYCMYVMLKRFITETFYLESGGLSESKAC